MAAEGLVQFVGSVWRSIGGSLAARGAGVAGRSSAAAAAVSGSATAWASCGADVARPPGAAASSGAGAAGGRQTARRWRGLAHSLPGTLLLLFASAVAVLPLAHAAPAEPLAADPALEARVMAVAEELRCLVCQNETLAASEADLAVDLRRQIRERLRQGESPARIVDFMVARYGEFVRYRPALTATTGLLWFGPFLLLALGGVALAAQLRVRRRGAPPPPPVPLDEAEQQRLQRLLSAARPLP